MIRLVTPASLRELSAGLHGSGHKVFADLAGIFEQCAQEIESRDAEIDGLKRALDALKEKA